jgi:DNA-binding NtrC family response regulator
MPKILIVDDEPRILAMLRITFERAGYDVGLASNVEEAMAALRSQGVDVVLSDVTMPGASGYQLAEWVAVNHPRTPTLLMSGGQSFRNGAEACYYTLVRKPFAHAT